MTKANLIFITGTDTGVGKTLCTALLLERLRSQGRRALALKPFCSGTRADAELLLALEAVDLTLDEVNPFFFDRPLAPLAAARSKRQNVSLEQAVASIRRHEKSAQTLLIEGSGGLLVPLGLGYSVADLIKRLRPSVIVVARNRLGTINHTLLTVNHMQNAGIKHITVVLMGQADPDLSSRTNVAILKKMMVSVPVFFVPYAGIRASTVSDVKKISQKLKKTLAGILNAAKFTPSCKCRD